MARESSQQKANGGNGKSAQQKAKEGRQKRKELGLATQASEAEVAAAEAAKAGTTPTADAQRAAISRRVGGRDRPVQELTPEEQAFVRNIPGIKETIKEEKRLNVLRELAGLSKEKTFETATLENRLRQIEAKLREQQKQEGIAADQILLTQSQKEALALGLGPVRQEVAATLVAQRKAQVRQQEQAERVRKEQEREAIRQSVIRAQLQPPVQVTRTFLPEPLPQPEPATQFEQFRRPPTKAEKIKFRAEQEFEAARGLKRQALGAGLLAAGAAKGLYETTVEFPFRLVTQPIETGKGLVRTFTNLPESAREFLSPLSGGTPFGVGLVAGRIVGLKVLGEAQAKVTSRLKKAPKEAKVTRVVEAEAAFTERFFRGRKLFEPEIKLITEERTIKRKVLPKAAKKIRVKGELALSVQTGPALVENIRARIKGEIPTKKPALRVKELEITSVEQVLTGEPSKILQPFKLKPTPTTKIIEEVPVRGFLRQRKRLETIVKTPDVEVLKVIREKPIEVQPSIRRIPREVKGEVIKAETIDLGKAPTLEGFVRQIGRAELEITKRKRLPKTEIIKKAKKPTEVTQVPDIRQEALRRFKEQQIKPGIPAPQTILEPLETVQKAPRPRPIIKVEPTKRTQFIERAAQVQLPAKVSPFLAGGRFARQKLPLVVQQEEVLRGMRPVEAQISALKTISVSDVLSKSLQEVRPRPIQKVEQVSKLAQITTPAVAVRSIQDVIQESKSLKDVKPISAVSQIVTTRQKVVTKPRPIARPPFFFGFDIGDRQKISPAQQQGHNVFVKSKGKFLKVNPKPVSKSDAIQAGATIVDNSAAATFVVRKAEGRAKQRFVGNLFPTNLNKYRRPSKRGKLPKGNTFVENNAFRIDTIGELQGITAKGLIARRQKTFFKNIRKASRRLF